LGALIDRLKSKGKRVATVDLALLSPVRYDHIEPYGAASVPDRKPMATRPLRFLSPLMKGVD
jgi:hypothetical protein